MVVMFALIRVLIWVFLYKKLKLNVLLFKKCITPGFKKRRDKNHFEKHSKRVSNGICRKKSLL